MTEAAQWRDYSRSRAVVVGAWDYLHLPPVPAARKSMERLAGLLASPLCGWPTERVEVLSNLRRRENVPDRLMELYEDAADVALFYFVGHGQLHEDQLALALRESPETGPRRLTTGLPFTDVRAALRECGARTKIVILDCCFAGNATQPENSLASTTDLIELTAGTGAFTMAASGMYRTAWFETGEVADAQTYFTKYLVDTIERGFSDHPGNLPLGRIFRATADALGRDRKPEPTRSVRHDADQFIFARNSALSVPDRTQVTEITPRFPDPVRSRIVIIGTPSYVTEELPDIPQIAANVADLTTLLTTPELGGFNPADCRVVPATAQVAEVGRALLHAAQEADDLLLIYYAGHGMLGSAGDLYLGLASTEPGPMVPFTGLPFDLVRRALRSARATSRVAILDASFSGRAIGTMAASNDALGQMEIAGSYTLTASSDSREAAILPGETHTAFTERLLAVLRSGLPGAGEWLSLDDIYRHLRSQMLADGLPAPQQSGTATAHLLKLVRNRLHPAPAATRSPRAPALANPGALPEDLRAGLSSDRPGLRAAAVRELAEWLDGPDPAQAVVARVALQNTAINDIPVVADVARAALDSRVSSSK
ncbi:caspase family protein [Kitasatospora purpeofusca]|uniref:caspase family protein n=1 Tax=Kitasatospora purpeofusca TaxID=67352 RepID=UPI0036CE5FA5